MFTWIFYEIVIGTFEIICQQFPQFKMKYLGNNSYNPKLEPQLTNVFIEKHYLFDSGGFLERIL